MASRPRIVSNSTVGKRLLTVRETAEYLGLKVETVYKKARLRELPFVKVGRALRFDPERGTVEGHIAPKDQAVHRKLSDEAFRRSAIERPR
jgi:excisionase family DNA binding protein